MRIWWLQGELHWIGDEVSYGFSLYRRVRGKKCWHFGLFIFNLRFAESANPKFRGMPQSGCCNNWNFTARAPQAKIFFTAAISTAGAPTFSVRVFKPRFVAQNSVEKYLVIHIIRWTSGFIWWFPEIGVPLNHEILVGIVLYKPTSCVPPWLWKPL